MREGIFVAGQTVTKRQLCDRIAAQTGCTQLLTKAIVQQFMDEVKQEIAQGNRIELRNFGVLATRLQPARESRNPRTGEPVKVPPKAVVCFKAGKEMAHRAGDALRHLRQQ